ncbi:MAG TPA: hypothetical protein P5205_09180 [Candidatus Paceibacterota bacterium]|nr:hypothetical protein [Verrucomicrobiota bacterium]HSA10528.1 hypothetical protein [Candidatus Paceibacterota bacterium]
MSDIHTQAFGTVGSGRGGEITVSKSIAATAGGSAAEVYTMTIGGETISLLPLRNWSQLDVYKWRARGKLPGTPAGLEITFDHVRVTGETVSIRDPEGAAKLQRLLNEWLAFARGSQELTQQMAHPTPVPVAGAASVQPANLPPRFRVEIDKEGRVHIHCLQGKETLATIGLNLPGLNSLINQGLMHKPHALQVGALHDWVELDGEFFSFEKGNNDSAKLEKVLNERYVSTAALGQGKEVVVFSNVASPTGFDIQFAAKVGGVIERRRWPLNEESLTLLQSPDKCGLLPRHLVIKLSPPSLIFKRRTPDGGERYLDEGPEHTLKVVGDNGEERFIDLSQPVNYLRLTAVQLTAVFNHPAINLHGGISPQASGASQSPSPAQVVTPSDRRPGPIVVKLPQPKVETKPPEAPKHEPKLVSAQPRPAESAAQPVPAARLLPNLWLEDVLGRPSIRHDWFTLLIYRKMAEHYGNSHEDMFGPIPCWASRLGDVDDVCDRAFRGIFLTQKGGLAYLNQGHIARFHKEVAFVGTLESAIEGIGVGLKAVGADSQQRVVFIVTDHYHAHFGLPDQTVVEELKHLREYGALLMSVDEVLHSPEPIEVVWTVPAEQQDADDPQAVENARPGSAAAVQAP